MRQSKKHNIMDSVNESMKMIISEGIVNEIFKKEKIKYPDNFINKIIEYIKRNYPEVVKIEKDEDSWFSSSAKEFLHIYVDEDDGQPTNLVQHPLEWTIHWDLTDNLLSGLPHPIDIKVTNLNKDTKLRGHTGEGINESRKDIKKERDDIERAVQDLNRLHNFDVSYKEMTRGIGNSSPQPLSSDIWDELENTESNEISVGDFDKVFDISNKYNKSNPLKLKKKLSDGTYNYPIIVRFDDRYWLVAGNTRLCTAAAMGITPEVIIADINKPYPVDESLKHKNKRL